MNIVKFENKFISKSYLTISILGKSYKLNMKYVSSNIIELSKKDDLCFELMLPKKYKNCDNIDIINQVIRKLYSEIAPKEIETSLELIRYILKFAPEDYIIERLPNSFYKIKNKILIINPDIVQYNREIINTTLIQAFCKIKYRPNSNAYKQELNRAINYYEEYKQTMNESNIKSFNMVG